MLDQTSQSITVLDMSGEITSPCKKISNSAPWGMQLAS